MSGNSSGFGRWLRWGLVTLGVLQSGCLPMSDRTSTGPASEVVARGFSLPPRLRYGKSPTLVFMGKQFIGGDLGTHGYYYRSAENNGVAYTARGGHIDTTHLRVAADWTAFLAAKSYRHLMRGDTSFSFGMIADRSRHEMHITYPANWSSLSPEQREQDRPGGGPDPGAVHGLHDGHLARDPHLVRLQIRRHRAGVSLRVLLGGHLLEPARDRPRLPGPAGYAAHL